jgi:chaperone BCS1
LKLSCVCNSTEPVKELIKHIGAWHSETQSDMTGIWRPEGDSYDFRWSTDSTQLRPIRPMSTVTLDMAQKVKVAKDINDYLQPSTA